MKVLGKFSGVLFIVMYFLTPYISMLAEEQALLYRGYRAMGGEVLVPMLCFLAMFILNWIEQYCKEQSNAK